MEVEDVLAPVAAFVEFFLHRHGEAGLDVLERDSVLRTLGSCQRRFDLRQFELEHVGEDRIRRRLGAVHALRLAVGGHQVEVRGRAAGIRKILQRIVVDREEAAGRAVFGRHVADRGTIGDREIGKAGAEIFHELADDAALAQHLGDGEHEIGRGHALLQLAGELHADHLRQQHRIGLAQHRRLRLDAADAPTEHGQAIDHCGVGIGSDQRVRVGDVHHNRLAVDFDLVLFAPHRLRQIFEIDLVTDAGAGRHDAEVVERFLRPFEEFVPLPVLPIFLLDVLLDRAVGAEERDRHRVIADEIDRNERIDLLGVAAKHLHGVAHGGEIDDRRHPGEVLHQDAGRAKGDLAFGGLGLEPLRNRLDVLLGDRAAILVPQQILQQHLHGERQPRDTLEAILLRGRQAVIGVSLAAHLEGLAAAKTVE